MRLIRLKEVINITGLGRSSIYSLMAENKFPQSIQLNIRAVAWVESDVHAWVEEKVRESHYSKVVGRYY